MVTSLHCRFPIHIGPLTDIVNLAFPDRIPDCPQAFPPWMITNNPCPVLGADRALRAAPLHGSGQGSRQKYMLQMPQKSPGQWRQEVVLGKGREWFYYKMTLSAFVMILWTFRGKVSCDRAWGTSNRGGTPEHSLWCAHAESRQL